MKTLVATILKVGVSSLLLYILFRNIDIAAFWRTIASADPAGIAGVAVLFVAIQALSAYRWSVILAKDMDLAYSRVFSIYLVGMFFNNFLPTLVGGDVVKGYYLYKRSGRGDVSVASIFLDRYSGFTALMCITAAALTAGYGLVEGTPLVTILVVILALYAGISMVLWVSTLHGWAMRLSARVGFLGINTKIDTLYRALMSYKSRGDVLAKAFALSLGVQGGVILTHYILGRALGIEVSFAYYFLFVPITTVVSMIPVSLSGLGLREGAFVYLFTRFGATAEQALTLSLIWFAVLVVVSLAGGVEYVRMGRIPAGEPPGGKP